jgi:hypothetical protein
MKRNEEKKGQTKQTERRGGRAGRRRRRRREPVWRRRIFISETSMTKLGED